MRRLSGLVLGTAVAVGAVAAACSAENPSATTEGAGGNAGPAAATATAVGSTGTQGEGGLGFGVTSAGSGGGATSSSGAGGGACEAIAQQAVAKYQPADIVFAIDTSGSMGEETALVRAQMNAFSQQIIASGVDVHVVMLGEMPPPIPCFGFICPPGICIDPPLGSGNCPFQDDTKLPSYFHLLSAEVGSTDGLNVIIETYPGWKAMLRPEATKTLVAVTDDDATSGPNNSAATFIANFTALDPMLLQGFKMSAIYCFSNCPSAANVGTVWKNIVDQTGGLHGDLCTQNFQTIFDDLAKAVVTGSKIDCQWTIPPPPVGQTFDAAKVNVIFTDGSNVETELLHVATAAACDPAKGGWYYDDNASPTKVLACPTSCTAIQDDPTGKIDVLFGCATKDAPPPQ